MKAKDFLDQLNPQSVVFEENICYEYTERQLILFAELYHKHQAKNNEVLDLDSKCPKCGSSEWVQLSKTLNECVDCKKVYVC